MGAWRRVSVAGSSVIIDHPMNVIEQPIQVTPGATATKPQGPARSLAFVAPRHPDGSNWPWLSRVGPMRKHRFSPVYIETTCWRFPKATRPYMQWQYWRAMRRVRRAEVVFLFSVAITCGMTRRPSRTKPGARPRRIYVGFTQDGAWDERKLRLVGSALRRCDAVTVFSEDERQIYLKRYSLDPARVHLIPIHTDEPAGYDFYPSEPPAEIDGPYALSLGSPNRRFTPIARACHDLGIPLVIITRPTHKSDSLEELRSLGATIITDANRLKSLTYLKHARLVTMAFQTPQLPGAFTTLIHAMFLGTPSVVTSCLGMSDYVVHGENGLVAPHGDENALQQAIETMWRNETMRREMTQNGLERAQRRHSLEAAADRFEELLQRVAAG